MGRNKNIQLMEKDTRYLCDAKRKTTEKNNQPKLSLFHSLQHHLEAVVQNLTTYMAVYPIDTKEMVDLIAQCQQVGATFQPDNSRTARGRAIKEEGPSSWTFLTAIVPGNFLLPDIFPFAS